MKGKKIFKWPWLAVFLLVLICLIGSGSFYAYWNMADPGKTCASCHEIRKSLVSAEHSSHSRMHCNECHGNALSNGIHSLKEKGMMVVSHLGHRNKEDIKLTERQLLEVSENCYRCHATEYAKWNSGGHSVDYQHIFLDQKHNTAEQINPDCLRCHGMFFKGRVDDLVEPLNIKGPWKLRMAEMASWPAIPCMACHRVHQDGVPRTRPDYSDPKAIHYQKKNALLQLSFYDRHEKTWFPVSELPKLNLWYGDRAVKVLDDLNMRNCVQCHAPNAHHQGGTSDDRTPRGVHEGLSCLSCHEKHSNDAKNSCGTCHPAISNCKLDVTKMNTSYIDSESPNNIHFVACLDCHKEGIPHKKTGNTNSLTLNQVNE